MVWWCGFVESCESVQIVREYGSQVKHGLGELLQSSEPNPQIATFERHHAKWRIYARWIVLQQKFPPPSPYVLPAFGPQAGKGFRPGSGRCLAGEILGQCLPLDQAGAAHKAIE